MTSVANNTPTLKKRIIRFFDSRKNEEVKNLITELSCIGEVLAFGGVIRDLALYGSKNFNSDIDLVVDCTTKSLQDFTTSSSHTFFQNKFGGYRTKTKNWTIDIWPLSKTWAFENTDITPPTRENLLKTTITNWDAIAFSFKDKKILCPQNYISTLKKGELDIVLEKNPHTSSVLLRSLRAIFDHRVKKIMPKALNYLKEELLTKSDAEIIELQHKILKKEYFSHKDIKQLREEIEAAEVDFFGSPITPKGTTKSLI